MPEPTYDFEHGFCEILIDVVDPRHINNGYSFYLVSPRGSAFICDAVESKYCVDVDMPYEETDDGEVIDMQLYFVCVEEFIDWIEKYYVFYQPDDMGIAQWPPDYSQRSIA